MIRRLGIVRKEGGSDLEGLTQRKDFCLDAVDGESNFGEQCIYGALKPRPRVSVQRLPEF